MLFIINHSLDPAFNLAAEEYLLTRRQEDCFMLWRNQNAVIVGRNQNTLAQVNIDYVEERNIPVVRRLSGGGTVYHDLGNINFTFIRSVAPVLKLDFRPHMEPVVDFLRHLNVAVAFDSGNDLAVHGRKVSGNAQYLHRQRLLHHGTLLFDADLHILEKVLSVDPDKFHDKGIDSIRKRVTNIRPFLPDAPPAENFMQRLFGYLVARFQPRVIRFQPADLEAINRIADEKYRRWRWNFGFSPRYDFSRSLRTAAGTVVAHLDIIQGVIEHIRFTGDFCGSKDIRQLEEALVGVRHQRQAVRNVLRSLGCAGYLHGINADELLSVLF